MMKYHALCLCIFMASVAIAQDENPKRNFEKGEKITALYFNGGISNNDMRKNLNWSVSPQFGYFIAPNLAVGIRASIGKAYFEIKKEFSGVNDYLEFNHKSLAPELFVRYYAPNIKIKPYVQVALGYNFQWGQTETNLGVIQKRNGSNSIGSLEGGIMFPVGKRFSLDLGYNYRVFSNSKLTDPNGNGTLRLGVSLRF